MSEGPRTEGEKKIEEKKRRSGCCASIQRRWGSGQSLSALGTAGRNVLLPVNLGGRYGWSWRGAIEYQHHHHNNNNSCTDDGAARYVASLLCRRGCERRRVCAEPVPVRRAVRGVRSARRRLRPRVLQRLMCRVLARSRDGGAGGVGGSAHCTRGLPVPLLVAREAPNRRFFASRQQRAACRVAQLIAECRLMRAGAIIYKTKVC